MDKSNIKTDIYVVVNPNSGSYSDSTYHEIQSTLKQYLHNYPITDITAKNGTDNNDNSKIVGNTQRMIVLKTSHANHASEVFASLSLKEISNICLIIMIGGDGIIHEVVNGLFSNPNNEEWINIFPLMCVCPLGSGNHLANLVGTDTIDKFYNAIELFSSGDLVQKTIIPNIVLSNQNIFIDSMSKTSNKNKKNPGGILSINTIVVGTVSVINEKASLVASYLPRILAPLKYELGTMMGIFTKEYFIITVKNDNNVDNIIDNAIGLFIQTTPSCGNNFMVDSRINGSENGLSYAYIKDISTPQLIYEFAKERIGYKSADLVREYDTDNELVLNSYIDAKASTLTIDGQNDKIQLPATIRRYDHSLKFLSPCHNYELSVFDLI